MHRIKSVRPNVTRIHSFGRCGIFVPQGRYVCCAEPGSSCTVRRSAAGYGSRQFRGRSSKASASAPDGATGDNASSRSGYSKFAEVTYLPDFKCIESGSGCQYRT